MSDLNRDPSAALRHVVANGIDATRNASTLMSYDDTSLAGLVPVGISGLTHSNATIALCPRPTTEQHDWPRTCRHSEVRLALGALAALPTATARVNGIFYTAMDGPQTRGIVSVLQAIPDTLVSLYACCASASHTSRSWTAPLCSHVHGMSVHAGPVRRGGP